MPRQLLTLVRQRLVKCLGTGRGNSLANRLQLLDVIWADIEKERIEFPRARVVVVTK